MSPVPAADIAVHVLDYLYKKLDEVCLVHGGEVVVTFPFPPYCNVHYAVFNFCPLLRFTKFKCKHVLISGGNISDATTYFCWKCIALY